VSDAKVTVVGAGQVGASAALLLAQKELAAEVVLVDVAEGLPQGKALDMMHARSVERFSTRVTGANDYSATVGSDVVVMTAGIPRRPGMSRDDLLATNAGIVKAVVPRVFEASPDAILICVTNPLDIMVDLAWKTSGMPAERVFGMGGVLDSARFAYAIAEATGAPIGDISALVVGAHGDAMVPLPRLSTVAGAALTELLSADEVQALVARTVDGGAEVVALLKTGSAYYAPAASVVAMVAAVLADAREVMPSCVRLTGQYGIEGVHMSVPARLGRSGVQGVLELDLTVDELASVRASAGTIAEGVAALEGLGV
jgi:malate dehydrogenase